MNTAPAINLDAPAPNPFPHLRSCSIADEQQARLTALEAEREELLAELDGVTVAEIEADTHAAKFSRLGAISIELRALAERRLLTS